MKIELAGGIPMTEGYDEIEPETGMQKAYVVLSPEERAKGFVRPLRTDYVHVGKRPDPQHATRELTEDEKQRYGGNGYVLFEVYPSERSPAVGRFWTQEDLNSGCQGKTTMGLDIAETYARDPNFYGGTFCSHCRTHFPLEQFVWVGTNIKVGT